MNYNINPPVSLPETYAKRSELMKVIHTAAKKQAVYLYAPGGYGKTVSVMLWAESVKQSAFWYLFDEYDNTLVQFYRVWCISLLSLLPRGKNEEFSNIIYSSAFNDAPVECTVDFLTRGLFGGEKLVFILDDFHMITDGEIKRTLPFILKRMPQNITMFFLSRAEEPASFEMLKASSKFCHIGMRELAFRDAEVREYFSAHELFITESESTSIRSYTEGQAALLRIMAENGVINKNSDEFILLCKDYYEKNLWGHLDEADREFLLKTTILNKFTLELCESLTGQKNCKDILDALVRKNASISFADGIYFYNPLFLEFMREKIKENGVEVVDAYKSVVEYYMQKDNINEVHRYAFESGNSILIEKALILFLQTSNLDFDRYIELSNIVDFNDVPEPICDKVPAIYLSKQTFYFLTGNSKEFIYNCDKLHSHLDAIMADNPQWVNFVLTYSVMDYRIGVLEYLDFVNHGASEITDDFVMTVSRTGCLQLPFLHKGVRDLYELAHTDTETVSMPLHNLRDAACGMEAGIYLEQNRLDEANEKLLHGESLLTDDGNITTGFGIYIMLAETALLKNDRKKYEEFTSLAKAYFENHNALCYRKNFLAYEARTKLWDGNVKTAREWLGSYAAKDSEFGYLYKILQNFTTARSHIVLNEGDKALDILERIKSVAKDFDRLTDAAEADVLISLTEWGMGKKKEAAERLRVVLHTLYPHYYIRVVANEGKAILPVMKSVIKRNRSGRTSTDPTLFDQYVRKVYIATYEQSKRFKGLTHGWERKPIKLSPRQTLILELLEKGHNNAEITEIMGISINTVKSYTAIAYQKLGVNNAMDAISKAKQIGILH